MTDIEFRKTFLDKDILNAIPINCLFLGSERIVEELCLNILQFLKLITINLDSDYFSRLYDILLVTLLETVRKIC